MPQSSKIRRRMLFLRTFADNGVVVVEPGVVEGKDVVEPDLVKMSVFVIRTSEIDGWGGGVNSIGDGQRIPIFEVWTLRDGIVAAFNRAPSEGDVATRVFDFDIADFEFLSRGRPAIG